MVRLKRSRLSCLAVVLVLLSVTGESSCESSSSLSASPEESTGGETKPGPLDTRRPEVSSSDTPLPSVHVKGKCPFGIKKSAIKRNWAAFTSSKPKCPFSKRTKVSLNIKLKRPSSKNCPVTVNIKTESHLGKTPKVTLSNKSKCRIRNNKKVTVRKKAKCPVAKNWATNINSKPTGPFGKHKTVISKTRKCPFSKHHKVSVNTKLLCPLRKTKKVLKSPYKRIMMGGTSRNPKCPLRSTLKGPVQKKTKRPFSKNIIIRVSSKPKCPFRKYRKVPVKKNTKSPLKKNLPFTISKKSNSHLSSKKIANSPSQNKKTVTMIHKEVSLSSVRPRVPPRNEPKLPPSSGREVSPGKKSKRSVSHSSGESKCPFEMLPFKKPTKIKTKELVPPKPTLSNKEKMDFLIRYQLRLFIRLKFASCVPCRRRLAFPRIFPIYIRSPASLHGVLGTPSPSSSFESTICEGRLGQFRCPDGETIQIESAFYGRQNLHECPNFNMNGKKQNTHCRRDVTAIISKRCNNRCLCYIYVDDDEMRGDPCPNTYKYMHFTASCVTQNQNQNQNQILMADPSHQRIHIRTP